MNAEHDRPDYPLKARARAGWGAVVPGWYLRLRLRWAAAAIARLEKLLADEFALEETAPLQRELDALHDEHEKLRKRLSGPNP